MSELKVVEVVVEGEERRECSANTVYLLYVSGGRLTFVSMLAGQ
jgi:hypothetical protein